MLVEDDAGSAKALRALLQLRGFDVVVATTVADGLAALRATGGASTIDYVVLDLMLPDGDGAQILRHVRERNLGIPVCVTTGVNDRARLAEVKRLEPRCLLMKPIDLAQLLRGLDAAQ